MAATALENITSYMEESENHHEPVMVDEVLEQLQPCASGVYVDGTVGLGGHSVAILDKTRPDGFLIGVDRDRESLAKASERLKSFSDRFRLVHDNFKNLSLTLNRLEIESVDGILLDLGISSWQLLSADRGFSFQTDAILDMRMDRTQSRTATNIVNETPEKELADIIYQYGEERFSRRIAAAIVNEREIAPITRCSQLAGIVSRVIPVRGRRIIHPATRTFQALRIVVNEELRGLEEFLSEIIGFLKPHGRLVVISFHSLEDRIVKRTFRKLAGQCVCDAPTELCRCERLVSGKILTPRPLTPGPKELTLNPRARSARLRAVEKI